MHLKIITHDKIIFDDDVDEIYTKTTGGEIGILNNHIPIMTTLDIGITKIKQAEKLHFYTTMGGILQFKDNNALILTENSESEDNIDIARAESSLQRAKSRLLNKNSNIDFKRAEASLARAKARLKITSKN